MAAAGSAHHTFERDYLNGARDEQWAAFYTAYLLGRLGDFAAPPSLTRWLESAPAGDDWADSAATHVLGRLRS